ncbi:MAG: hypothetical protein WC404_00145 [Candidatus Omnitrophota bacterium]|jgi:hypothetical protein
MDENGSTEVRRCAQCNKEISDGQVVCRECYEENARQQAEDSRHPDDHDRQFA